uniref:Translational initiation factor 1 n=1 Tax=Amyema miraculosa TaxID=3078780 RepID=A0AA96M4F8_9MAGN|nr:translational initiation factor 1 [Amyema miraculosa]WNR57945.1 translational initiation factor 1 [Amyema miraculosa]
MTLLTNGMFQIRLDNEDLILGYVFSSFIRIRPDYKVKIEISCYDLTKGRIIKIYRLCNKDSKD